MKTLKKEISSISNLEAEIMLVIWNVDNITVREVYEILVKEEFEKKEQGFLPYTTVMSTMSNLANKGILNRDRKRKTYIYSAGSSRRELTKSIIKTVLNKIL
jgi:predicted transcriptional regulator